MNLTTIQPFSLFPTPLLFGAGAEDPIFAESTRLGDDMVGWWAYEIAPSYTPTEWADRAEGNLYPLLPFGGPSVGSLANGKWLFPALFPASISSFLYRNDEAGLRYNGGDVTFSAWFYSSSATGTQTILSKNIAGAAEYDISRTGNSILFRFWNAGRRFFVFSPAVVQLNTWMLVIAWYDEENDRIAIQINAGEPTYAGPFANDTQAGQYSPFVIGAISGSPFASQFWIGRLEQVVRWNRLLNAAERLALFTTPLWEAHDQVYTPPLSIDLAGYPAVDDPPAAPTFLGANTDDPAAVALSWANNAGNEDRVEVERSIDAGAFALLATLSRGTDSYTDDSVDLDNHSYTYRVRASNDAGDSDYSNEVNVAGVVDANGYFYRFSAGTFYLLNPDLATWHAVSFENGVFVIAAASSPAVPTGAAPETGANFEFSDPFSIFKFRLYDSVIGQYREIWAEDGAFTWEDPSSSAITAGQSWHTGPNYKFENGSLYLYDQITEEWLMVSIYGEPGTEQLQLGPIADA